MILCRPVTAAAFLTSLLTGCASIVGGTNQIVTVETKTQNGPVIGALCKLENSKGVFYVTTPGSVGIQRAYGDLAVKCEKDPLPPGLATVKSSTRPMAFGNILVGGVIGAAVDTSSGAAYDYPQQIRITMGETTEIKVANIQEGAPPPSGYADIKDVEKLAQFGGVVKKGYETYLTKPLPRAFAFSDTGSTWSSWGVKPKNPNSPKEPYRRVVMDCEEKYKAKCHLYAIDNDVVYRPEQDNVAQTGTSPQATK